MYLLLTARLSTSRSRWLEKRNFFIKILWWGNGTDWPKLEGLYRFLYISPQTRDTRISPVSARMKSKLAIKVKSAEAIAALIYRRYTLKPSSGQPAAGLSWIRRHFDHFFPNQYFSIPFIWCTADEPKILV